MYLTIGYHRLSSITVSVEEVRLTSAWCVLKLSSANRCESGRGNCQEAM